MSALAGRWNFDGKPDAATSCKRMLAAQRMYGPHDVRQWHGDDGVIALGRCLFRTLPEDVYDRQPLAGANRKTQLVADVRLDNRDELVDALRLDGSRASTLPDSAILLAAWERWQEQLFDRLVGDYAFALWDGRERRLILARDPMGARPLHYHLGESFLAFASMPKGLHALPDIPYAPDEQRVAELLALIPETGSRSYFEGVCRVPSGHVAMVTAQGVTVRRHWEPRRETLKLASPEEYADALREHFDRAVAARLRGGGSTIAAHLSGGKDSGAVAATAARLLAPSGGRVVGFTSVPRIGYDGPDPEGRFGDEGPLASETAALHSNLEQVLVRSDGSKLIDRLDRAFFLFDRPLLNACNQQWIDAINTEARNRGLTVSLTGQMGNLTISYAGTEMLAELVAQGRWLRLIREGRAIVKAGRMSWRGVLATSFGPWAPTPVWNALNRLADRMPLDLSRYSAISQEQRRSCEIDARARQERLDLSYRPRKNGFETRLWALRRIDLGNFHKGVLAGWEVDTRDPTSDRRLMEFCLSVPMEVYLANGEPAALARRAFSDRLPERILSERRKGLQAIDWHDELAASRVNLQAEIERLWQVPAAAAAIDLSRMRTLTDDWPASGWNERQTLLTYRYALLRGVATGHFLRKASGSNV